MSRTRSAASAQRAHPAPEGPRELSPRQQQILDMLRAGKVNKEIAAALGIGLGTVKQHVVALFKKLDVSNRTMAVSRSVGLRKYAPPEPTPALSADGALEYRPCVVLSVAVDQAADAQLGRKMQQVLAAFAFDHDALFLARKGHAGDLIFGVQRATEQDLFLALRAARGVAESVALQAQTGLRGALTAGLAIASMRRSGGWSGEAIASIAISQGRELASAAAPGELVLGVPARELLRVHSPNAPGMPPERIPFSSQDACPWVDSGSDIPLIGREAEAQRIESWQARARSGSGGVFQISGETGMGKSRLCRHAAACVAQGGGRAYRFICRPDGFDATPYVTPEGMSLPAAALFERLAGAARTDAVLVDDCHQLDAAELDRLLAQAARSTCWVLLTARRFPETTTRPVDFLRLGRLAPEAVARIAAAALGRNATAARIESVVGRAAGVPLFALELARQRRVDELPLSLRMLIAARMDSVQLDRVALRLLARARGAWDVNRLCREMGEPREAVEAAVALAAAAGVLARDADGKLRFSHPLLRQAIALGAA